MKECLICKITKPMEDFYKRNDKNQNRKDPYNAYCKKCTNIKTVKRQQERKIKAVEYKGSKCENCGYNKCIAALEFHHLDPNKKDFGLTEFNSRSFESIKDEIDKCKLLCSNCHKEEHYLAD